MSRQLIDGVVLVNNAAISGAIRDVYGETRTVRASQCAPECQPKSLLCRLRWITSCHSPPPFQRHWSLGAAAALTMTLASVHRLHPVPLS